MVIKFNLISNNNCRLFRLFVSDSSLAQCDGAADIQNASHARSKQWHRQDTKKFPTRNCREYHSFYRLEVCSRTIFLSIVGDVQMNLDFSLELEGLGHLDSLE